MFKTDLRRYGADRNSERGRNVLKVRLVSNIVRFVIKGRIIIGRFAQQAQAQTQAYCVRMLVTGSFGYELQKKRFLGREHSVYLQTRQQLAALLVLQRYEMHDDQVNQVAGGSGDKGSPRRMNRVHEILGRDVCLPRCITVE